MYGGTWVFLSRLILSKENQCKTGLKQNLAMTLLHLKQNLNMSLNKNEFRTKYNIYLLCIPNVIDITLFEISCQLQQQNRQ